jgi:hypothetical protein
LEQSPSPYDTEKYIYDDDDTHDDGYIIIQSFFFVFNGRTIWWWIMEYLLLRAPFPNDHGRPLLPRPLPSDGGDTLAAFEQVFSFQ